MNTNEMTASEYKVLFIVTCPNEQQPEDLTPPGQEAATIQLTVSEQQQHQQHSSETTTKPTTTTTFSVRTPSVQTSSPSSSRDSQYSLQISSPPPGTLHQSSLSSSSLSPTSSTKSLGRQSPQTSPISLHSANLRSQDAAIVSGSMFQRPVVPQASASSHSSLDVANDFNPETPTTSISVSPSTTMTTLRDSQTQISATLQSELSDQSHPVATRRDSVTAIEIPELRQHCHATELRATSPEEPSPERILPPRFFVQPTADENYSTTPVQDSTGDDATLTSQHSMDVGTEEKHGVVTPTTSVAVNRITTNSETMTSESVNTDTAKDSSSLISLARTLSVDMKTEFSKLARKLPLMSRLRVSLRNLKISRPIWYRSSCSKYFEIHFCCSDGIMIERVLEELSSLGIGSVEGTAVAVIPLTYAYAHHSRKSTTDASSIESGGSLSKTEDDNSTPGKDDLKHHMTNIKGFMKSVRSRLTVPQVLATIGDSSEITFDYVMLIILASLIAALGLRGNSSVVIVASMLISPLMGPILGIVFSLIIGDSRLLKKGMKAEMLGLVLCLTVGFLFGLIDGTIRIQMAMFEGFPTVEMCDRGQWSSLIVGIFIALPSGAGVALSVLGGNIGSLVGVAISASLLPPAVNCGYLLGVSLMARAQMSSHGGGDAEHGTLCASNLNYTMNGKWVSLEMAEIGLISLFLTLINILCIIAMGLVVLKIKQVSPISTFSDSFWKEDVKISKDYYRRVNTQMVPKSTEEFLQNLASMYGLDVHNDHDRNVDSITIRQKVVRFASDLNSLNPDLNLVTRSVYRYGAASQTENLFDDVMHDLPPKWTEIFSRNLYDPPLLTPTSPSPSTRFEIVTVQNQYQQQQQQLRHSASDGSQSGTGRNEKDEETRS